MNHKLLKALSVFIEAMRPYVIKVLQKHYPDEAWEDKYFEMLKPEKQDAWKRAISTGATPQDCIDYNNLNVFVLAYKHILVEEIGRSETNRLINNVSELCDVRNPSCHFKTLDYDDIERAFSNMKHVARLLHMDDLRNELTNIWNEPEKPQQTEADDASEEEPKEVLDNDEGLILPDDTEEAQDEIIRTIIQVITQLNVRKGKCKGFTIYVSKQRLIDLMQNEDFKRELRDELDNWSLEFLCDGINITTSNAPNNATHVMPGLALALEQSEGKNNGEEASSPRPNTGSQDLPDTSIEAREDIIKTIIKALKPLYGTDKKYRGFTIYVSDQRQQALTDDEDFKEDLHLAIENEELDTLFLTEDFPIEVSTDGAPTNAISIMSGMWVVLNKEEQTQKQPSQSSGKMTITIYEEQGSLKQSTYVLEPDEKKNVFHIGRCNKVMGTSPLRINHVVINEEESDPNILKLNMKVSRSQANIVYRNGHFFLKAMIGGCRPLGNSSTKIIRGESIQELLTTDMLYPLLDGDIIEMGKAVMLLVNIVADDKN